MANHPHEIWQKTNFGCYHVSNGRRLPVHIGMHYAADLAGPLPHEQQEERLRAFIDKDPLRRQEHAPFDPASNAVRGARAYNVHHGMPDPHERPYHDVSTNSDIVRDVGRAYGALPERDNDSLPHFHAMRDELTRQFDHLTKPSEHGGMGVHVESVDYDPYKDVHEMVHDLRDNNRIKVLGTRVTGSHPFFSDDENDRFRAVHDVFGHAATGRGFDAHGEHAAFAAHSKMFSAHARPAMASETLGQNSFLHLNGDFGPQKIAVLPHHLQFPTLRQTQQFGRSAKQHEAVDWGEYRRVRDGQNRRYERAGIGGGREEFDQYFGQGEHRGHGTEERITPQKWMQWSRQPTFDDLPEHEQEWQRGHELGETHGRNAEHADFNEMDRAYQHSRHPEHFYDGYVEGLNASVNNVEHQGTRYAVRRSQKPLPKNASELQRLAHQISTNMPDIVKLSHDSGDGMTVFHCPFDGSGQVIARSDGSIECEFCQATFSITIQPQYPAFPQTINGVPVDVPGMGPTWGDPMGNAVDPEQVPEENDDAGSNSFDDEDEDSESGPPEGLTKKTFRTEAGEWLEHDAYLRHLALRFTLNRGRTLRLIRQANLRTLALDVPTHVHVGDGERVRVITEEHARGDSRPVDVNEFTRVATYGKELMDEKRRNAAHPAGLHDPERWNKIKEHTYNEIHKSWGGATIHSHTGEPLASDADAYAVTVKPPRTDSVSTPENPSRKEWSDAMDTARDRFHHVLRNQDHYLGVFHDDDLGRVDIDPVLVTKHRDHAEAIGAYTHNVGGAYNFSDGNGYWPPHVKRGTTAAQDGRGAPLPFRGIGHWYATAATLEQE